MVFVKASSLMKCRNLIHAKRHLYMWPGEHSLIDMLMTIVLKHNTLDSTASSNSFNLIYKLLVTNTIIKVNTFDVIYLIVLSIISILYYCSFLLYLSSWLFYLDHFICTILFGLFYLDYFYLDYFYLDYFTWTILTWTIFSSDYQHVYVYMYRPWFIWVINYQHFLIAQVTQAVFIFAFFVHEIVCSL